MKRFFLKPLFLLATLFSFVACDDENKYEAPPVTEDVNMCYVVNSGNWNANDGSIQILDLESGVTSPADCHHDIFATANNTLLGDVVQDLIWKDDKIFVSVSGSQKVEVLGLWGERLRSPYLFTEEMASPRCFATDGNLVYVTNYDGHVYAYSTADSTSLVKKIAVGSYPEGISYCDGYLVVNNSDYGRGNGTISVIDVESGERRDITEGVCNPYTQSVVCGGEVYIIDSGNYADIPSSICRISPKEATMKRLDIKASLLATDGNILYYVNSEYNYETYEYNYSPLYAIDVATGEKHALLAADKMQNVNSLSVDPETGNIFVGYATYGSYGNMLMFDSEGIERASFDVGYYTNGARFRN